MAMAIYFIVLLLIVSVSLVLMIPDLAIVLLMATLGLGLPLLFLPTLAAYLLCLLPYVLSIFRGRVAILSSIGVAVALYFGPHLISAWFSASVARDLTRDDIVPAKPVVARTVELRSRAMPNCDDDCRSLLLTGNVDWVRVVQLGEDGEATRTPASLFQRVATGACEPEGANAARGDCIRFADDTFGPAKLVVEVVGTTEPPDVGGLWLVRRHETRSVSIKENQGGQLTEILRHTQSKFDVVRKGTFLMIGVSGMQSGGLDLLTRRVSYNEKTLQHLLQTVGFRIDPVAAESSRPQRIATPGPRQRFDEQVRSVLDLPADRPLNEAQRNVVSTWIGRAALEKVDIGLLRRAVRDLRIQPVSISHPIFSRDPVLLRDLLRALLDRVEASAKIEPVVFSGPYDWYNADSDVLQPHADRILAIVRRNDRASIMIMSAVGKIGIDPADILRPASDDPPGFAESKIRAACYADDKWSRSLISMLRPLVAPVKQHKSERSGGKIVIKLPTPEQLNERRRKVSQETIVRALLRHGDIEYVKSAAPDQTRLVGLAEKRGANTSMCSL